MTRDLGHLNLIASYKSVFKRATGKEANLTYNSRSRRFVLEGQNKTSSQLRILIEELRHHGK